MGEPVLELGNEELKKIGDYVQSHLSEWVHGSNVIEFKTNREMDLLERMVRVEEELKNQRELMNIGFTSMDKRFEQIGKRFEQVDKRFESFEKRFNRITAILAIGFITVTTLITVFQFLS